MSQKEFRYWMAALTMAIHDFEGDQEAQGFLFRWQIELRIAQLEPKGGCKE